MHPPFEVVVWLYFYYTIFQRYLQRMNKQKNEDHIIVEIILILYKSPEHPLGQ